jgi:ribosome recycling factor
MATPGYDKEDMNRRMNGAVATLKQEFAGLADRARQPGAARSRHGRGLWQPDADHPGGHGQRAGARLITVQVWDKGLAKAVDKAIRDAGLGLNPQLDGQLLRIPLPELNEERRKELVKLAHKYAEQARIAVRNVRRDGMEILKKLEKDHKISQDEHHKLGEELQKLTDAHIRDIDQAMHSKEQEIMQV